MKIAIGLLSLAFLAACAEGPSASQSLDIDSATATGIVGAELLQKNELGYRAAVALIYDGRTYCSGTLIGSKFVLTAGHCLAGRDPQFVTVKFFNGAEGAVKDATVHAQYREASMKQGLFKVTSSDEDDQDIGLILLHDNAPKSAIIAKLPRRALSVGQHRIRTYGIGRAASGKGLVGVMNTVQLQGVVRPGKSNKIFYAQKNGKGVCEGDSGGPHFTYEKGQPVLSGLTMEGDEIPVFFGRPTGDACRATGVALQTASYLDWIAGAKKHLAGE